MKSDGNRTGTTVRSVKLEQLFEMHPDEFIDFIFPYLISSSPLYKRNLLYEMKLGRFGRLELASAAVYYSQSRQDQLEIEGLTDPALIYATSRNLEDLIRSSTENYFESHISIKDFDIFSDPEFIHQAYRLILNREPDPAGFHFYMDSLAKGHLTRNQILGMLYFSPETDQSRIKIQGAVISGLLGRISRKFPILRPPVYLLNRFIELPLLINRLIHILDLIRRSGETASLLRTRNNMLENHVTKIIVENRKKIELLENKIRAFSPSTVKKSQKTKKKTVTKSESQRHLEMDAVYAAMHSKFNSDPETTLARLESYLPRIHSCESINKNYPLIDLGCGKGELLHLLHDDGIPAVGVDSNILFIKELVEAGFQVEHQGIQEFMEEYPDESAGGISALHLIEHLNFEQLFNTLYNAYRVLAPGGILILETPNPENLLVSSRQFYIDPTHKNPIHPQTLLFLLEQIGFSNLEIIRLNPAGFPPPYTSPIQEMLDTYQTYAAIAWKK